MSLRRSVLTAVVTGSVALALTGGIGASPTATKIPTNRTTLSAPNAGESVSMDRPSRGQLKADDGGTSTASARRVNARRAAVARVVATTAAAQAASGARPCDGCAKADDGGETQPGSGDSGAGTPTPVNGGSGTTRPCDGCTKADDGGETADSVDAVNSGSGSSSESACGNACAKPND